ncbi:MAG: aminotransferase class I/II-fold pyridoxal phosphate-dependent enzyme [Bacteroidales bacterium]|nr:aminotransferase class I/II-fold pyridoxal phosphate-dependent enzyme [Bacteroidales bacterium]
MKKKISAVSRLYDLLQFGEFGGVNPSITDSSTYTFLNPDEMEETFHGHAQGCFLYSRHWNPSNKYLADAVATMENTESAWITASGMAAISCAILQICSTGDHLITSITTYGGTYAFLKNYLKKFNIEVSFVNITDLKSVEEAVRPNTKLIYTESVTNPLLQVSDIPALAEIAARHHIKLMVDNTFTPLIITPTNLGADFTVYSLTKFVNGKNDCVAGAICGRRQFIDDLADVHCGTAMLLGPVLDPLRSSGILKNMHTLHLRMQQHSKNAMYLAEKLGELNMRVIYPGLENHPQHKLMKQIMNEEFGFGGMMAIVLDSASDANRLMQKMQQEQVGYLAVSLGYFKTLFSCSGKSTSSEIPREIQQQMGLSEGLLRFSVGLDHDIGQTFGRIKKCLEETKLV